MQNEMEMEMEIDQTIERHMEANMRNDQIVNTANNTIGGEVSINSDVRNALEILTNCPREQQTELYEFLKSNEFQN